VDIILCTWVDAFEVRELKPAGEVHGEGLPQSPPEAAKRSLNWLSSHLIATWRCGGVSFFPQTRGSSKLAENLGKKGKQMFGGIEGINTWKTACVEELSDSSGLVESDSDSNITFKSQHAGVVKK